MKFSVGQYVRFINSTDEGIITKVVSSEVVVVDIEDGLGRERNKTVDGYTSRIIDIDILYFGVRLIEEANLHVPHHHLYRRKFVLLPLNDIAPDFIDPFRNKSVSILLNECEDSSLLILHSKI